MARNNTTKRTMSLTFAIFIFLMFFSLLVVGGTGALVYWWVGRTFFSYQERHVRHEIHEIEKFIKEYIDNKAIILQDYAGFPILAQAVMQPEAMKANVVDFMDDLLILGQKYQLVLLDYKGRMIHSTEKVPKFNYKQMDWVRLLVEGKLSRHIEVSLDGNNAFWRIAVPVKYNNHPEGVLIAEIPLEDIDRDLKITSRLEDFYMELVKDGKPLVSFGQKCNSPEFQDYMSSVKLSVKYRWDMTPFQKNRDVLLLNLFAGLFVLLLGLMIITFLAANYFFAKPLIDFRRFTRAIAVSGSEYYFPMEFHIREIQFLVDDFNRMGHEINLRESALRNARDNFEQMVEKRTYELQHELSEKKKTEAALRESEKRFRDVADSAGECIWEVDESGRLVFISERLEDIQGSKPDELIGKLPVRFVEKKSRRIFRKQMGKIYQNKSSFKNLEFKFVHKSGKCFWLNLNGVPLFDRDNRFAGYRGAALDISFRKMAEQKLKKAHQELEERVRQRTAELERANSELKETFDKLSATQGMLLQSEKMASIGQLAAGIAHEINNPAGFVSSNLNTLADYISDYDRLINEYMKITAQLENGQEVSREDIEALKTLYEQMDIDYLKSDVGEVVKDSIEGMKRISKIVSDLKDYSHVDKKEVEQIDVNESIEKVINVAWNELKYKAEVIREFGEVPPVTCYGGQIGQVFMNLLVNAAQAMTKKGHITIRTYVKNDRAIIEIADDGKGIPQENLNKIFDPFFTSKPVGQGTGLGLNIVYNIIKNHNGDIFVSSELGKGTTFVISLPIA